MTLNLQFFAEEAGEVGAATDTEGVAQDVSATSESETAQAGNEDVQERPSFDELIKGEYKKDYQTKLKGAIDKRFKNQADLQGKLDSISPIISQIAGKYGIKANDKGEYDLQALNQKLAEDNSMYEQEAFERGMDVETLKQIKELERRNEMLERQQKEEESRKGFEQLLKQADETKAIYPDFDLDVEMLNEDFGRLVGTGVPVKTAYQVIHQDEILESSMRYATQKTREADAKAIQSGTRPIENGVSDNSSTKLGATDVSKLNLQQLADIKRRSLAGENITFA